MRTKAKRYEINRALALQKRTGRPSLTLRTTPVVLGDFSDPILNKNKRPKKRLMDLTEIEAVRKLTGSGPYVEAHYV